jgi:hypothetical protein
LSSNADSWLDGWSGELELRGVAGYRLWRLWPEFEGGMFNRVFRTTIGPRGYLASIGMLGEYWHPGMNVASCAGDAMCLRSPSARGVPVPVPAVDHACGLYVVRDLTGVAWSGSPLQVVGAVQGWGRGIEHGDDGWRMQFAQVLALLHPDSSSELGWKPARSAASEVEEVGRRYDVPVVDRLALVAAVERVRAEIRQQPA